MYVIHKRTLYVIRRTFYVVRLTSYILRYAPSEPRVQCTIYGIRTVYSTFYSKGRKMQTTTQRKIYRMRRTTCEARIV